MALAITIVSILAVILKFAQNWLTAKARLVPVYWLMIVGNTLLTGTNIMIAVQSPESAGVLALAVLNLWGISMGIWGLRRKRNQKEEHMEDSKPDPCDEILYARCDEWGCDTPATHWDPFTGAICCEEHKR